MLHRFSVPVHGSLKKAFCPICPLGKSTCLPFSRRSTTSTKPLDLLHLDVWGPAPLVSNGCVFYLSIVDDHSHFTWLFPLAKKSDVTFVFIRFKKNIENLHTSTIKAIQTYGGGEFVNKPLTRFLQNSGITHHLSYPYITEQNGLVERKHRHLVSIGLMLSTLHAL